MKNELTELSVNEKKTNVTVGVTAEPALSEETDEAVNDVIAFQLGTACPVNLSDGDVVNE